MRDRIVLLANDENASSREGGDGTAGCVLHPEIPYGNMWADDPHWLPRVLKGEKLLGKVWFKEDGKTIEDMEWAMVSGFL